MKIEAMGLLRRILVGMRDCVELAIIATGLLCLTACGGGGSDTPVTYTIGGTVTGMTGTGLTLQNNGGNNLSIASNGAFSFTTAVASGGSYSVSVLTQPTVPSQTCTISNAAGTASANVANVAITCVTNTYTVGGTVSGLNGTGLVLQNTGANNLTIGGNGVFTFTSPVASAGSYNVTVLTQPGSPAQTCSVASGAGNVVAANISNIAITCVTNTYSIGGTVSGLNGTGLVLQNSGGNDLAITASGAFTFSNAAASGSAFNVTVKTQPTAQPVQMCTVAGGGGSVGSSAITNIAVNCHGPTGRFLYVPNTGDNTLSAFSIDAATGELTKIQGSPFAGAGTQPRVVKPTASESFLYVTGGSTTPTPAGSLAGYSINSTTGALTPIAGMPLMFSASAFRMFLHPSDKFLYFQTAVASGQASVNGYAINASSGALTAIGGTPFSIGNVFFYDSAALDPTGAGYYTIAYTPQPQIAAYSIDSTTGALSSAGQTAVPTLGPVAAVIDPAGKFLYVTTGDSGVLANNKVLAYTLSPLGGITGSVPGSPFDVGTLWPGVAVIDKAGKHLYTLNRDFVNTPTSITGPGSVSAFNINSATGVLTTIAGSPFATGDNRPNVVAFDPAGAHMAINHPAAGGKLTLFSIDANTGALAHITGSPFAPAVGNGTGAVNYDSSGRFAYLADGSANIISLYSVDAASGQLTYVSSYPTGSNPTSLGIAIVGAQ